MSKRTSVLWLLLPVAACSGAGALAPASLSEMEPAVMASVASFVAPPAEVLPAVQANDVATDGGCGFTHRGDQSRSLQLAVTGLHRAPSGDAKSTLAWTAPPFQSHLDGYEYRAYLAREGAGRAAWVDTGALAPTVELSPSRSGREYAFDVVARYRYPLGDGHVYFWYGPVSTTQQAASPVKGCGSSFGEPDTTLAIE